MHIIGQREKRMCVYLTERGVTAADPLARVIWMPERSFCLLVWFSCGTLHFPSLLPTSNWSFPFSFPFLSLSINHSATFRAKSIHSGFPVCSPPTCSASCHHRMWMVWRGGAELHYFAWSKEYFFFKVCVYSHFNLSNMLHHTHNTC